MGASQTDTDTDGTLGPGHQIRIRSGCRPDWIHARMREAQGGEFTPPCSYFSHNQSKLMLFMTSIFNSCGFKLEIFYV